MDRITMWGGIASALLLWIAFEDLKHRAVHWWLFLLTFACFGALSLQWLPWQEWISISSLNLAFIGIQLSVLTAYFSFKNKRFVLITHGLLGAGDIAFMVCCCASLGTIQYVVFHVVSLVLALGVALVFPRFQRKGVPLAGFQALFLFLLLVTMLLTGHNPYEESWMLFLFS